MTQVSFDKNNEYVEASPGTCILSENNLKVQINYATDIGTNIPIDREKSYWEFKYFSCTQYAWTGFVSGNKTANRKRLLLRFLNNGRYLINDDEVISTLPNVSIMPGDVVGMSFDKASQGVGIYINGEHKGDMQLRADESGIYPAIGCSSSWDSEGITAIANFGATPFVYPIPAGYQPLDMPQQKRVYLKDNVIYGM